MRAAAFFQHSFDRFLASSAILSHAAARINVIGALRAAADGSTDALVIQPVADADDHSRAQLRGVLSGWLYRHSANDCQFLLSLVNPWYLSH